MSNSTTQRTAALQTPLSFTVSQSLLIFMLIELVMLLNHLIFWNSILLLPSISPSIRVLQYHFPVTQLFTSDGQTIEDSTTTTDNNSKYSVFISFRIDFFDLLAIQGTLKCLLQHHNSKASILQCSAFSMDKLSITNGKTIALNTQTFLPVWCLCLLICCLGLS